MATDSQTQGAWRAWLIVGAARDRRGRHEGAVAAYRRFLSLCRRPAERAYAAERIRHCQQAQSPHPRPVPISHLLSPERLAGFAGVEDAPSVESTEHFVVHAYNAALAKLVARQAETALTRICSTILSGQDYPHAVTIHVWPDAAEYRKHATSAAEWTGGAFSLRQDENGQTVRRIDLTQRDAAGRFDATMLDRVLPHELCHLVVAELFGDAPCPLAVNEGLAMMAEAGVENSRILLAGSALAGEARIGLADLLLIERCDAKNAAVFYAESFSLTSFLHARLTRKQFRAMLEEIKAGCPLEEALQRALYLAPDRTFLDRLARAWEDETIRQSQFLRALEEPQRSS